VIVIQPPCGDKHKTRGTLRGVIKEEVDKTTIRGFPNQHSVLNQYSLMMEILPHGKDIKIGASFDSNLISTSQLSRMIFRWERIIDMVSQTLRQGREATIQSLDSVYQQDIDEIWTWNRELPVVVDDRVVFESVQETANSYPSALAIDAWDGRLTYSELDTLSPCLCQLLISLGVGSAALCLCASKPNVYVGQRFNVGHFEGRCCICPT
jgi:non-ribosomal peptide synthetase component F